MHVKNLKVIAPDVTFTWMTALQIMALSQIWIFRGIENMNFVKMSPVNSTYK
jgi:hypothetical protein